MVQQAQVVRRSGFEGVYPFISESPYNWINFFKMDPVGNPFIAGAGVPPPELAGRPDPLERAGIALQRLCQRRRASSFIFVGALRNGLIAKGMIYSPAHGDTAFTVPLFDEFLRRTIPSWHTPYQKPQAH